METHFSDRAIEIYSTMHLLAYSVCHMHISLGLKYSVAQSPDNENFMVEIRKYACLNNRFSKEHKDKY